MKKHTRIFALALALSMMILAGCSNLNKTYNSVEEWYDANPMMSSMIQLGMAAEEDSDELTFDIEGNAIVYGLIMEEEVFGIDAEMDQFYKEYFDSYFSSEDVYNEYSELITSISELCGIPESEISVRIDIFNPGSTTPGYTTSITK